MVRRSSRFAGLVCRVGAGRTPGPTGIMARQWALKVALLAVVAAAVATGGRATVTVPSFFSDNMVLQTNNQYGARGFVWGWADPNEQVTINLAKQTYSVTGDAQDGSWRVMINPHGSQLNVGTMTISGSSNTITIKDVSFGEVYLCSGQSNMVFPLKLALNASEEIASAAKYPNLRLFTVAEGTATTEQKDVPKGSSGWLQSSPTTVPDFSAMCFMTARDVTAMNDPTRPTGLIFSAVGGTRVEAWMSPAALAKCSRFGPVSGGGTNAPSGLWNAMIAPFIGYSVRTALWYQGEANAEGGNSTQYYDCMFQNMISDWRARWSQGDFPFMYQQLPPSVLSTVPEPAATGRAEVRAAQAMSVPRPFGPIDTTGMSVGIDMGGVSAWGVDHPPNKNEMSRRMALQVMHVAYAAQYPAVNWTGPLINGLPTVTSASDVPQATSTVSVPLLNWTMLGLRFADVSNCTTCCAHSTPFEASSDGKTFVAANGSITPTGVSIDVPLASVSSIRYAWTDYVQCVLMNDFGIAAAPFWLNVTSREAQHEETSPVAKQASTWHVGRKLATPPMGFNTWNAYHTNVDEQLIIGIAEKLKSSGLHALGYEFVNIDDGWQVQRYPNGTERPDPARFPSGIAWVAEQVHNIGLKFGVYTAAHGLTCQKRPGSYMHETIDAATLCDWKVDYLKIDQCGGSKWPTANKSWILFKAGFDKCFADTGHSIVESVESCGSVTGCGEWISQSADLWRIGGDIQSNWQSITSIIDHDNTLWPISGPTMGWNDADMLQVGNAGLSFDEQKSHFALWCLLNSPLLIGTDLLHASNDTFAILGAAELIGLNQDSLGVQGRRVASTKSIGNKDWLSEADSLQGMPSDTAVPPPVPSGTLEVWAKPLSDGSVGAILLNRGSSAADITVQFSDLPWLKNASSYTVRDLWAKSDLGTATSSYTGKAIATHAVDVLRITPVSM